ncbi:hypothetical protein [Eisenbergiella porci]|uniref:hypothetical protein n=1 Tax=Eisenbergiella porci TaxID=2652274 RepID=UPI002A8368BE|nr:hypothetical protein [Eisenbergiella porci]
MMAFYKLYYIIHRRTDFYQLWRWMDEMMHPEYYAEKKQHAHDAIMHLAMITNIMHSISGSRY